MRNSSVYSSGCRNRETRHRDHAAAIVLASLRAASASAASSRAGEVLLSSKSGVKVNASHARDSMIELPSENPDIGRADVSAIHARKNEKLPGLRASLDGWENEGGAR